MIVCPSAVSGSGFSRLLESPGNFSEKSCNFLGYDVGRRHNDAGAGAKICEN